MKSILTLRALYIDPARNHTEIVVWDQSLGQLFDWIGYSYYWIGDRQNKIYHVPAGDDPQPGEVHHPRWLRPLSGSLLIVSANPTTGEDASLSLYAIDSYCKHLIMTPPS